MIGYKVFRSKDCTWRLIHGALVPLTAAHAVIGPSRLQVLRLLFKAKALFVRWEECFDSISSGEWWHVIKDVPESMDSLSSSTRSKVRRGLKRLSATSLSRDEVIQEGYDVYRNAFDRYETFEPILSQESFVRSLKELPGETEFWGVRDKENGRLVAFSENVVSDDACFYNTIWFDPSALNLYSSYVLFYEMNTHYLNNRKFQYVSDGSRSISHDTHIHDFLQKKFLFRKAYAVLRIRYFPIFSLFILILYNFRNTFASSDVDLLKKLSILCEQERIRRLCVVQANKP